MKSQIAKALRILAGVIVGSVIFVAGTWVLSKALANNSRPRFHGHTLDFWAVEVESNDVSVSNRANAILNQEIIPQLTDRMFHDTNDSKIRLMVINALDHVVWISYVDYYEAPARRSMAAADLGVFGPAGRAATPALMQAVQSGDANIHEPAITSLGKIHSQPDVVIPFLMKYLTDDDLDDEAASALGEYGSLARPAVPKIIPLLHADDDDAQVAAHDALLKIDPVAFTNATKIQAKR
ncbi:MAG TPA: HEAT repeat domain-containing protein [Verrucomicrobiae bacterium]|nr:HEAT repeat domain-containing protein [Verrucomicrobiae bacterium]